MAEDPQQPHQRRTLTLSAAGNRVVVVNQDEALQILACWEAQTTGDGNNNEDEENVAAAVTVTCLDMSCRVWTLEVLQLLRTFLLRIAPTIEVLKLDDIIASLPTNEGLAVLGFFNEVFTPAQAPVLRDVNLDDNALGTRGHHSLTNLVSGPSLQHLSINNCGMSYEVAAQLRTMLQPVAANLRTIDLGRNMIGKEGAASFAELLPICLNLRVFRYAGSRPVREGTRALATGLATMVEEGGNHSLIELDMNDCVFGTGDEEADPLHPLCTVLRGSPHLQKLILKDGALDESGFEAVLDALVESQAVLHHLDVGFLNFGEEGAQSLVDYLQGSEQRLDALQELHVECDSLEDTGLNIVLDCCSTKCPNLRVLNVSDNELTADGFRALLDNRVPSLHTLVCKENNHDDEDEIPVDVVERLRQMYPDVQLDLVADDDEQQPAAPPVAAAAAEEEEEEAAVDALVEELGATNLNG